MKDRLIGVACLFLLSVGLLYQAGYVRLQHGRDRLTSTINEVRDKAQCQPKGRRLCGYDEFRFAFGTPTQRLCYRYLNHILLLMESSCMDQVRLTLQDMDLSQMDLAGIDLRNTDLSGSDLHQTNLSGSSLRMSDLSYANLSDAVLEATQTLYKMDHASLRGANLRGATAMSSATFKGTDFTDADLRMVDFGRSNFIGSNFTRADLRGANLAYSHLPDVQFSEARVENLVLHQASGLDDETLARLKARGAIVDPSGLEAALRKGIKIPIMWWFDLSKMNLSGVDFSGVKLSGAIFTGAQLDGAKFVGSSLDNANFRDADLGDADFSGSYLIHADFRGADLRGARFTGAVRLDTIKTDSTTKLSDATALEILKDSR